jgi:predicted N-acetyltransferase YhbS
MLTLQMASFSDLVQLAELYEELTAYPSNLEQMKKQFKKLTADSDYIILVAKKEEIVVGSVMGVLCYDLVGECKPFMVLDNVIVKSQVRGQGIGCKLMKKMEEIARSKNCNSIQFVSRFDRKDAHRFYVSLGYELDLVQGFKKYL